MDSEKDSHINYLLAKVDRQSEKIQEIERQRDQQYERAELYKERSIELEDSLRKYRSATADLGNKIANDLTKGSKISGA